MSDKVSTGRLLGRCPYCKGQVFEMKYVRGGQCEPPQPECSTCRREVPESEIDK